jgi:type VI secretion system protein ImpH
MEGTHGEGWPVTGEATDFLIKMELLKNGHAFSFFQAMRLVRHLGKGKEIGDNGGRCHEPREGSEWVRPRLSLGFPASGVSEILEGHDGKFTIVSNILALYGSGSPLPTFYTEDLFEDVDTGDSAVRDMLDVINHRLYQLLFDAWTKYRSMIRIAELGDRSLLKRFFNLIGMDEARLGHGFDCPETLLRYSGLFSMNSRSASGLETMLSDALGVPVTVVQMVERKGKIPEDQAARLGTNIRLGVQSSLGREVVGRGGSFRIDIGPVSNDDYQRLVPGKKDYNLLVALTGLYVSSPFEYDVDIKMDKREKPGTTCLSGNRFSRLGLDTWVFSNQGPDEFRTRFHPINS